MYRMYRPTALLLPALVLAACGGSGGTNPQLLTPGEVGGVYSVCSLAFQPTGLQAVDLLATVTEPNPAQPLPAPNLKLSTQVRDFELEYTPLGDVLPRRFTGSYVLGSSTVTLQFAASEVAVNSAILLTQSVHLDVEPGASGLVIATPRYTVPRQDYGRLAGLTEEQMRNLQERIEGTLVGNFTRGSCS
jgi:hypothetical protein